MIQHLFMLAVMPSDYSGFFVPYCTCSWIDEETNPPTLRAGWLAHMAEVAKQLDDA